MPLALSPRPVFLSHAIAVTCTLLSRLQVLPNPEPPLSINEWENPALATIERVHADFGSWSALLSLYGVVQRGDWVLGCRVSQLAALRISGVKLHIEEVELPQSLACLHLFRPSGRAGRANRSRARPPRTVSNLQLVSGFNSLEEWAKAQELAQLVEEDRREWELVRGPQLVALQAHVRGFLARLHYEDVRRAVIYVQSRWRGSLERRRASSEQTSKQVRRQSTRGWPWALASATADATKGMTAALMKRSRALASAGAGGVTSGKAAMQRGTVGVGSLVGTSVAGACAVANQSRQGVRLAVAALPIPTAISTMLDPARWLRLPRRDRNELPGQKPLPSLLWLGVIELDRVQVVMVRTRLEVRRPSASSVAVAGLYNLRDNIARHAVNGVGRLEHFVLREQFGKSRKVVRRTVVAILKAVLLQLTRNLKDECVAALRLQKAVRQRSGARALVERVGSSASLASMPHRMAQAANGMVAKLQPQWMLSPGDCSCSARTVDHSSHGVDDSTAACQASAQKMHEEEKRHRPHRQGPARPSRSPRAAHESRAPSAVHRARSALCRLVRRPSARNVTAHD